MKSIYTRTLFLCFTLALCTLIGCTSPSETPSHNGDPISQQPSSSSSPLSSEPFSESTTEEIAYMITIQVNPHFEIHVGMSGQIISIQPLNEDAEQLCAATNVIHMTPENGLYILISQAHDDGLLEDGDTVDILLEYVHFSDESTSEHANSIVERVRTYLNLNQMPNALISMNLRSSIPPEIQDPPGETQDDSSPAEPEDPYLLDFETSADGICIYEKCYTDDGGTMEYYYSSNGNLQTTIYRDGFGTVDTTHYNSEGLPTSGIFVRIDGAQIYYTYGDAWNVIQAVLYDVDGSVITREFYPNSVMKSEHTLMANGSVIESAWTETGITIYTKEQYADGSEGYALCHENGVPKESYTKRSNGDSFFKLYDENGNEIYIENIVENRRHEIIYNEDRSYTETLYYTDGTSEILYVNSSGKAYAGVDREGKPFTLLNNMPVYEEE